MINSKLKFLIVDDEKLLRDTTAEIISSLGFHVCTAGNRQECLEQIEKNTPGIILLDVRLRTESGFDICRELKGPPVLTDALVILISGKLIKSEDIQQGLEAGADGYIDRTVPLPELKLRIKTFARLGATERDLRQSAYMLNETGRIGKIGGWVHNFQTGKAYWTKALYDIIELPYDAEPPGVNEHFDYYPPEERAKLEPAYNKACGEGVPFDLELQVKTAKDRLKWCRARGEAEFVNEKCVRLIGTFQDISEQKRNELKSKEQRIRLELAVEGSRGGEWHFTLDPEIPDAEFNTDLYISPQMKSFIGFSDSEFPNSILAWEERIIPEDLEKVREHSRNHLSGKIPLYELYYRIRHRNGKLRWIHSCGRAQFNEYGKPVSFSGIDFDVTEEQRTLEVINELKDFYENIFASIQEGIWVTEDEDVIYYVNAGMEKILGLSKEQIIGNNVLHDFPREELGNITRYYDLAKETRSPQRFEVSIKNYAGRNICLDGWMIPRFKNEKFVGMICTVRDVSDKKRNEQKLRESKSLLDATGRMAKVGGWQLNAETNELTWTEETCRIHELPLDYEPVLEEAINFYHPDERETLKEAINKAFQGTPFDLELKLITAKGNELWTRAICNPVIENGKVVKLSGTFQDITEKKLAEIRLKESELKYKTLFETIPDGITVSDKEGKIIESNKKAENILGLSEEEQTKRKINGKEWKIIRPNGTLMPSEEFASTRALKENRLVENVEMGIVRSENDIKWIVVSAIPIQIDKFGVLISYRDITEKRIAEDKLAYQARLLENVSDAVISTDAEFRILSWNRAAENLYGIPSDEAEGKRVNEIIPIRYMDGVSDKDAQSDFLSKGSWKGEVFQKNCRGEDLHIQASVTAVFGPDGEVVGAVAVNRDISKLKEAEKNLQRLSHHLQNLREEQSAHLAREIHDDVGQTITGLEMLFSLFEDELKQKGLEDPELLNLSGEIRTELDGIVNKIRKIATDLHPSILEISDIYGAVQWQIDQFAKRSKVQVEADIPAGPLLLPEPVKIAVFRIVQEALTNIGRHAEASKVELSLAEGDRELSVTIKDDGAGFDEKQTDKQQRFGLMSMYERAQFCGGRLKIESKKGEGCVLMLTVPLEGRG